MFTKRKFIAVSLVNQTVNKLCIDSQHGPSVILIIFIAVYIVIKTPSDRYNLDERNEFAQFWTKHVPLCKRQLIA